MVYCGRFSFASCCHQRGSASVADGGDGRRQSTPMNENWAFADSIPHCRQTALTADVEFSDLLVRIVADARPAKPRWNPASYPPLTGAVRFEVYIETRDSEAIDYFHNGCAGYRAQYAMSETSGDQGNTQAVEAVKHLVRDAMATIPNERDVDLEAVLLGPGVKVWIDQDIPVIRKALSGEQCDPELLVEPWVCAARKGEFVSVRGKRRFKANAGTLAPVPQRVVFRSAWWKGGTTVADPDKIERSHHLHIYGFA